MNQAFHALCLFTTLLATTSSLHAAAVTLDSKAARVTLLALENLSLSHGEALDIARLHGNQGVLQKLREFRVPVTDEDFALALVACAQNRPPANPREKQSYSTS